MLKHPFTSAEACETTRCYRDFRVSRGVWVRSPADLRISGQPCEFDGNILVLGKGMRDIKKALLKSDDIMKGLHEVGFECCEDDFIVTSGEVSQVFLCE